MTADGGALRLEPGRQHDLRRAPQDPDRLQGVRRDAGAPQRGPPQHRARQAVPRTAQSLHNGQVGINSVLM